MKLDSKIVCLFLLCFLVCFSCIAKEEQPQLVVRKIHFEGVTHFTKRKLLRLMDTAPKFLFWGGRLTDSMIEHDLDRIRKAYINEGFFDVEVTYERIYKSDKDVILNVKVIEGLRQEDTTNLSELSKDALIEKLKDRETSINFLTDYFEELKKEKEDTALKLKTSKEENENLKAAIKQEGVLKEQLETKVVQLESDLAEKEKNNDALKAKLDKVSKVFDEKIEAINNAKEILASTVDEINLAVKQELDAIELNPIVASEDKELPEVVKVDPVIKPEIKTNDVAIRDGKVILVKKQLNFVIANLGVKDGIKEGMLFNVNRGDAVLASVKVIEVRKKVSALEILEQQEGSVLKEGDMVRYLGAQIALN